MSTLVDSEDLPTGFPKTPTACTSAEGDVIPKLPLQQQGEWKMRLDSMKTQHQSEIFQQQEEHLRQLQSLQAQLLLELSGNRNASPSSPLLLLTGGLATPPAAHESGESQTNRRTTADDQAILSELNTSQPQVHQSHSTGPSALPAMAGAAHPSPLPIHQLSSDPHHSSSSQDCIHPGVQQEQSLLDASNVSPSHSIEFLQLPLATSLPRTSSTNSVATASSLDSHTRSRALCTSTDISGIPEMVTLDLSEQSSEVRQAPPLDSSQLSESGLRYRTTAVDPPSVPGHLTAGRSHYPGSSSIPPAADVGGIYTTPLRPATASVSYTPHSPLLVPSLCPPPITPSSLTPSHVAVSRTSLVGKHMKHVEDLKRYYESELSLLRAKVDQLRLEGAGRSPLSMSLSPLKSGERRGWRDNGGDGDTARLKIQCSDLQSKLDEAESEKRKLEEHLKRLQEYVLEWRERCDSAERLSSVLQERLEGARAQLKQQDSVVGQLQADLQVTTEELHFWKEQRTQDVEKMDQLFHECEILQKENRNHQAYHSTMEEELQAHNQELMALRAVVGSYKVQEAQHKSTIRRLEDEVRSLQHINNRLHSQATHYELGTYRSPHNRPDEDKLYPPLASARSSRTPPHGQGGGVTTVPPLPPRSSLVPATPPPHSQTLTRRKWLESSDPGLILGATPTHPSPSGMTPTRGHTPQCGKEVSQLTTTQPHPHHQMKVNEQTPSERVATDEPEDCETSPTQKPNSPASGTPVRFRSPRSELQRPHFTTDTPLSDSRGSPPPSSPPPTRHSGRNVGSLANSTLEGIRRGNIVAGTEEGETGGHKPQGTYRKHRGPPNDGKQAPEMSIEDRVQRHMQVVAEAEQRLASLQSERDKLESALQRTPKSGGRITLQAKQSQLEMERRLDEVVKEIGSVRMVLRNHHAL